jgi:hypothetical protein
MYSVGIGDDVKERVKYLEDAVEGISTVYCELLVLELN